jgi:hypothetical protein
MLGGDTHTAPLFIPCITARTSSRRWNTNFHNQYACAQKSMQHIALLTTVAVFSICVYRFCRRQTSGILLPTATFQNYRMICRLGYSVVYACRCSAPLSSCNVCFLNMFVEQQHCLPIILILIPLLLWYLETCNLWYWSHWSRTCNMRYGNYVRWFVQHLGIFNKGTLTVQICSILDCSLSGHFKHKWTLQTFSLAYRRL